MANIAVVGAQWGDEGKGKIVDLISERFQVVARFQGGPNAGHTVIIDDQRFALHHIPSGVFRPEVRIVIGNGMVLEPGKMLDEMDALIKAGIKLDGRFFISDRAHVILPIMKQLDAISESAAGEAKKIGTTLRGIGPTYQAKAARWGIRVGDLGDLATLREKIEAIFAGHEGKRVRDAGQQLGNPAEVAQAAHEQWERFAAHVTDTALLINDWFDEGLNVLFEGAQGTLLDLDHGSYPFVTSSTTLTGGLCGGLGVAPSMITASIGVYKAYTTRVGGGPMPSELDDDPEGFGQQLRDRGHEYGTTTGRPRRCGWFDGVAARYSYRINRFTGACVTKLDVLDTLEQIRICNGYRIDGRQVRGFPASVAEAVRIEPVYESMPGWNQQTTAVRAWEDLPGPARDYLDRLGEVIGTEVVLVGVGPERSQCVVRPGSWLEKRLKG
jgi:adenylosuccinate synthase